MSAVENDNSKPAANRLAHSGDAPQDPVLKLARRYKELRESPS
jgi:hypothetical protein